MVLVLPGEVVCPSGKSTDENGVPCSSESEGRSVFRRWPFAVFGIPLMGCVRRALD